MASAEVLLIILSFICIGFVSSDSPPLPDIEGEEIDCSPPFWHGELGDNWPLAGVSAKSKPKFQLIVRDTINGTTYKPKKWHRVAVIAKRPRRKLSKRIHGIILTQELSDNNATCGLGKFGKNKKKATNATVRSDCNDIILDGSTDLKKTNGLKWKAPKCGCITIQVEIKSADNMLFQDDPDDEIDDQYKVLMKTVCGPRDDGART